MTDTQKEEKEKWRDIGTQSRQPRHLEKNRETEKISERESTFLKEQFLMGLALKRGNNSLWKGKIKKNTFFLFVYNEPCLIIV